MNVNKKLEVDSPLSSVVLLVVLAKM